LSVLKRSSAARVAVGAFGFFQTYLGHSLSNASNTDMISTPWQAYFVAYRVKYATAQHVADAQICERVTIELLHARESGL
jgi:hypothetical protein